MEIGILTPIREGMLNTCWYWYISRCNNQRAAELFDKSQQKMTNWQTDSAFIIIEVFKVNCWQNWVTEVGPGGNCQHHVSVSKPELRFGCWVEIKVTTSKSKSKQIYSKLFDNHILFTMIHLQFNSFFFCSF